MIKNISTTHDESVADHDLTRRVAMHLAGKQIGDLRRLNVEVQQGKVRLTGRVASYYHRQLAISLARRVAGVQGIDDQISVAVEVPRAATPPAAKAGLARLRPTR